MGTVTSKEASLEVWIYIAAGIPWYDCSLRIPEAPHLQLGHLRFLARGDLGVPERGSLPPKGQEVSSWGFWGPLSGSFDRLK